MNIAPVFQSLEHDNLGEVVYGKLCDALIKGRLAPDARVTIRELAQSLGTSVTPVRDAILRLIQDEALIQKSARDVRVPILSPGRYMEIRRIRMNLEGLAARESAVKATRRDIVRLRELVNLNQQAIDAKDWATGLDCNQTFHFALAEIADMPVLRGILNRLWLQMGPVIAAVYGDNRCDMISHHYNVLAAIEAKDPDAAEHAISDDIDAATPLIVSRLDHNKMSD
jgi:DNA-binding GntR family transcriptional regulator